MAEPLEIHPNLILPADDLRWSATRSSGPGGQNVNKVSSKVELRFDLAGTSALSQEVKERLRRLFAGKLGPDGEILVKSDKTRDQQKNLADAREKLRQIVVAALVVPKKRRPTKPSRAAKARRLDDKRRTKEKKASRRADLG